MPHLGDVCTHLGDHSHSVRHQLLRVKVQVFDLHDCKLNISLCIRYLFMSLCISKRRYIHSWYLVQSEADGLHYQFQGAEFLTDSQEKDIYFSYLLDRKKVNYILDFHSIYAVVCWFSQWGHKVRFPRSNFLSWYFASIYRNIILPLTGRIY